MVDKVNEEFATSVDGDGVVAAMMRVNEWPIQDALLVTVQRRLEKGGEGHDRFIGFAEQEPRGRLDHAFQQHKRSDCGLEGRNETTAKLLVVVRHGGKKEGD